MLAEDFFTAVCGPPLSSNTAIAKDVAIYHHTLSPSFGVRSTFKKSATPPAGLAVSAAHVFAAQQDRAYIHVYSRLRGGQEAAVPVPEKVRCLALAGDVLVAGTAQGRLLLWETLSGRLISTPPCHVQAVSCLQTTPHHILSASDDSNILVWSLPQLLALHGLASPSSAAAAAAFEDDPEPIHTLARHHAAVTALAVAATASRHTSLCVSASRDKTVVLWNYQTGVALRTLLLAGVPTCLALDPVARALYVATEEKTDGNSSKNLIFSIPLFGGDKPLLGNGSHEAASTAVSITRPFAAIPADATTGGPATPASSASSNSPATTCLAISYDGSTLLSGHPRGRLLQWNLGDGDGGGPKKPDDDYVLAVPVELANLNAAITNIVLVPPTPLTEAASAAKIQAHTVVKPSQASRSYAVTVQFTGEDAGAASGAAAPTTCFDALLRGAGFPGDSLDRALVAMQEEEQQLAESQTLKKAQKTQKTQKASGDDTAAADAKLRQQNADLLEIVNEQQALYQQALQRYADLEAATRS